eukprot:353123-Chlamydomonas_euryale.AAC.1
MKNRQPCEVSARTSAQPNARARAIRASRHATEALNLTFQFGTQDNPQRFEECARFKIIRVHTARATSDCVSVKITRVHSKQSAPEWKAQRYVQDWEDCFESFPRLASRKEGLKARTGPGCAGYAGGVTQCKLMGRALASKGQAGMYARVEASGRQQMRREACWT